MTARVVIAKYVYIGSCSRVVVSTSNITISPLPSKDCETLFHLYERAATLYFARLSVRY